MAAHRMVFQVRSRSYLSPLIMNHQASPKQATHRLAQQSVLRYASPIYLVMHLMYGSMRTQNVGAAYVSLIP